MNKPMVSVIMPVFNAAAYVTEAVKSILNQTHTNLELIIVDDGCTDSSIERVHSLKDGRIVLMSNPGNLGLAASLNLGIRRSSGSFLARMDADDISMPTRIEQQLLTLESNRAISILGTGLQYFGASSYKNYFPADHELCKSKLLFNVCFGHSSLMARREVFEKNEDLYNPDLRQYSEDYDLYSRLVDRYQFANLQKLYVHYRTFKPSDKGVAENKRKANSKVVRTRILNAMGVHPSEQESEIHGRAANLTSRLDKGTLEDIAAWFDFLNEKNRSSNYFNERALQQILGDQLFLLVYHNARLRINLGKFRTFHFFRDYKIPLYLSFKHNAKRVLSMFN